MGLTLDVGLAGLPLGIKRVELEVEIMLGRFAGVDRAAEEFCRCRLGLHRCPSRLMRDRRCRTLGWALGLQTAAVLSVGAMSASPLLRPFIRTPKNRGPFQEVPVISRAIMERLG